MHHYVSTNMTFGDLRSLLHSNPIHEKTWGQLCQVLDHLDGSSQSVARVSPYIKQHVSAWPDALRVMPMNWVHATSQSDIVPWIDLTRTLCWYKSNTNIKHNVRPTLGALNQQELANILRHETHSPWTNLVLHDALAQPEHQLNTLFKALDNTLSKVTSLELVTGALSVENIEQLVSQLPNNALESFMLQYKRMDMARLGTLLQSPITQWKTFGLPGCRLTAVMMDLLASRLSQWTKLETLNFKNNHLDRRGYQALAQLVAFTKVTTLDLRNTTYQHQSLFLLKGSKPLEHLSISGVEDTAFDWDRLFQTPWLSELKTLHVEQSTQGDTLLGALNHAPCRKTLQTLNLVQCQITAEGLQKLTQPLEQLTSLDLSYNHFYEEMIDTLRTFEHAPNLTALHLQGNFITPKSLTRLARAHAFEKLEHIDLSHSNINLLHDPLSPWLEQSTIKHVDFRNVSISPTLSKLVAAQKQQVLIQTGHQAPFRDEPSLEAIRCCLQDYPSPQLWNTLSKLFHTIPKINYTPTVYEEINNALDQFWPDALRMPTQLWWQRLNLQNTMPEWWQFIRHIYVNNDSHQIEHLVDRHQLAQCQAMTINWNYNHAQPRYWNTQDGHYKMIDRLIASKSVQNLGTLTIQCNNPRVSLFEHIGQSQFLGNLEHLYIQTHTLPEKMAINLANMQNIENLKTLSLQQRIDGPRLPQNPLKILPLFNAMSQGQLKKLSLEGIAINAENLHQLCHLDLPHLEHLHLKHNEMNDRDWLTIFALAPNWTRRLRTLRINQSSRLTDQTIEAMVSTDLFINLEQLDLGGCRSLTAQSKQWIANAKTLPNLKKIAWPDGLKDQLTMPF